MLLTLVVIEIIFVRAENHPHLGLLVALGLLVGLVAISFLVILEIGIFMTFWIPAILAVGLRYLNAVQDTLKRRKNQGGTNDVRQLQATP